MRFHIKLAIILTCLAGIFSVGQLHAQQSITIDASQVISTFSFKSSVDPKKMDVFGSSNYNANLSGAYSLGYRNTLPSGVLLRGAIGMRNAGASTIIDQSNYQWNLQYMQIRAGAGYQFSALDKLNVYATLSPYFSYLLKANQRLNNQDFDIKKSGEIKKSDFGLYITPGVQFVASDLISVYGEFSYLQGLHNLETAAGQHSYNVAYTFTLGVAFTIE